MTNKIVIDLDGVLAGPKPEDGDYSKCVLDARMAAKLREYKAAGWTISIHTSRNARTHNNNLGLIVAKTVPIIAAWLDSQDVPYDEIWPNKPWVGEEGVYIDDRAVRPDEFLSLNMDELSRTARGSAFDPKQPSWRKPTRQDWRYVDLRGQDSDLSAAVKLAKSIKPNARLLLLLSPTFKFAVGRDEELRRLGVRWSRLDPSLADGVKIAQRELILSGEADPSSILIQDYLDEWVNMHCRHFNQVVLDGLHIAKTSQDPKLKFEESWMRTMSLTVPGVVPGSISVIPNGYRQPYARGGSLAAVLQKPLDAFTIRVLTDEVVALWERLGVASRLLAQPDVSAETLFTSHNKLITGKSVQRVRELAPLFQAINLDVNEPITVNGVTSPSVSETVGHLLTIIVPPRPENIGAWHGDFCPGNVVLMSPIDSDSEPQLRLIDPRGTLDNKSVTLTGDQRYDLGKLTHALKFGYDTIVEGWTDVAWASNNTITLRLWDENGHDAPSRQLLWECLMDRELSSGSTRISGATVTAIAALQLITCAPLHCENTERMVALVARGLEAAQEALQLA